MGFGWSEADFGPITGATVPSPVVVLFVHVPKCGGTTVRHVFSNSAWYRTHWSLTCRPTGVWHSHRLLKAVHTALRQNRSRIFAEWHQELNFSWLPTLEAHVRRMRPDVRFISFTILREPSALVASHHAYWEPSRPVNLSLLLQPEFLLFHPNLLNLSSSESASGMRTTRAARAKAALLERALASS
jgi:hypothetical protein